MQEGSVRTRTAGRSTCKRGMTQLPGIGLVFSRLLHSFSLWRDIIVHFHIPDTSEVSVHLTACDPDTDVTCLGGTGICHG